MTMSMMVFETKMKHMKDDDNYYYYYYDYYYYD